MLKAIKSFLQLLLFTIFYIINLLHTIPSHSQQSIEAHVEDGED